MAKLAKDYDVLGDKVTVTTEKLENDAWAQNMLREVGKTMTHEGFSYIGSAAVHFYSTGGNVVLANQQGQVKHQFALGDLSEQFAEFGAREFLKEFHRQFTGKRKSIDPKHKVQE